MSHFRRSIALKIALLGLSFPLFWSGNAWAEGCNRAKIPSYIIEHEAEAIALNNCDADVLPVLIEVLKHEYPFVRSNTIRGLVKISKNVDYAVRTQIIIPTLVEALEDEDESTLR